MFMWMCIVSEMVWCTSFLSALCVGSGKNVCLKILCTHKIFAGWECVDYHGVSKYNDGW